MDGWMDGRMDGWMDGCLWKEAFSVICYHFRPENRTWERWRPMSSVIPKLSFPSERCGYYEVVFVLCQWSSAAVFLSVLWSRKSQTTLWYNRSAALSLWSSCKSSQELWGSSQNSRDASGGAVAAVPAGGRARCWGTMGKSLRRVDLNLFTLSTDESLMRIWGSLIFLWSHWHSERLFSWHHMFSSSTSLL